MMQFVEMEFFQIYVNDCIAFNQPYSHKKDIKKPFS